MVLPDLEVRALAGECGLVFLPGDLGYIALIIYEVRRALDAESPLDLPVNSGDVPPDLVGYLLGGPSILEAGFNS